MAMPDQIKTESANTRRPGQAQAIYSICQVADLLGVAPIEVVQWLKNGWLPCRQKPNEPIQITQAQLVVFLRNRGIDLEAILAKSTSTEPRQARPAIPAFTNQPIAKPLTIYKEALALAGPMANDDDNYEHEDAPEAVELEPSPVDEMPQPYSAGKPVGQSPDKPAGISVSQAGLQLSAAEKILHDAAGLRASAVHLEISAGLASLALRIDGAMHSQAFSQPGAKGEELFRQFKALLPAPAGVAVSQSGKFSLTCSGRRVDFSLFACLTTGGEKIVINISDPQKAEATAGLATRDTDEQAIGALLAQPAGIIVAASLPKGGRAEMLRTLAMRLLSASPMGTISSAGTIASAMPALELPGVSYVKYDSAGGLSCDGALRNCASLDADLILADNLQDPPSLAVAASAAGQGRLVLAGMNAASVASALTILREMNLGDWVLADRLLGVLAIATVRRLCPHCKQAHKPSAATISSLGFSRATIDLPLFTARGCQKCNQTGQAGTIPLLSILKIGRPIAAMLRRGEPVEAIEQAGSLAGMRSIRQAVMELLGSGVISLSDAAKACPPEL
jgi:general secretion pathway protein E